MKCRVEGCNGEANVPGSARGMCRAHYRRWQRYGDENEPIRRIQSWNGDVCSESSCNNKIEAHGLCENHYKKADRKKYPEKQRIRNKRYKKRKREEQEQLMGRKRPEFCEVCGSEGYGRKPSIVFDHNHITGKPRGWLCDRCNKVLGLVKDNVNLLTKLIEYLERNDVEIDNQAKEETAFIGLRIAG